MQKTAFRTALLAGVAMSAMIASAQAAAPPACTYTTVDGVRYWTCPSGTLSSVSLSSTRDVLTLSTGTNVTGDVAASAENDVVTIDGATVGGKVIGDAGEDQIILNSGSIGTKLRGGADDDVITVNGGSVGSSVEGDSGWDVIRVNGGTIGGDVVAEEVYVAGGRIEGDISGGTLGQNNVFEISGGTIEGIVYGYEGQDTITITGGTVGEVKAGDDDDTVTLDGGTVLHDIQAGSGYDVVTIRSGSVGGDVYGEEITVSGGTISGNIDGGSIGQQNLVTVTGGTILGTINVKEGDDVVTIQGGSVGGIEGGDGDDRIVIQPVSMVTLNGAINAGEGEDTVTFDGAVEGVNLTLNGVGVDGGTDRDQLNIVDGSSLTLDSVISFAELSVSTNSSLTLAGTSYVFGPSVAYGVVDVDATSALALSASSVSLETRNFNLGSADLPGGQLIIGAGTETDATVEVTGSFNNYGVISLLDGAVGDKLTISGNYVGGANGSLSSGVIALDAVANGSGGTADTVVLTGGTVSGTTTLVVALTGNGGATGHAAGAGIQVVDASGATSVSEGAFQLATNPLTGDQSVIAGAYAYSLYQAGGSYYLQSDVAAQVPGYTVGPSAAASYAFMAYNTLDRRLGEIRQGEGADGTWQAWGRAYGGSVTVKPSSGWSYDQDTLMSQFGVDKRVDVSVGQLHVGAFAGYGSTDVSVRNSSATSQLDGWSFGGYATYFADGTPGLGGYVDVVAKADILDTTFSAPTGHASTDTTSWGVSAEVGYGFALPHDLVLKPQAELTYVRTQQDAFTDSVGMAVDEATLDNLVGRVGFQLQTTITTKDGRVHTPYIMANVLHDFMGDGDVVAGGTAFGETTGETWYTLGVGITSNITQNFALYGQTGATLGDVQGWVGSLGLRARF